jgi:hypothetical protein
VSDADVPAGRHRTTVAAWCRPVKAVAAGGAAVLVTAGLGWVTAVAVGLAGTSGEPVVDALPSFAPQAEPAEPTYGQTLDLDLDAAHADRARRSSSKAPPPTARPTSATTPAVAPPPTAEPSSAPTRDAVLTVRQGDPCRTQGAAAVTRSGSAAVCTVAPGKGELRWRRA